jgi:hypothetical protein
VTAPVGIYQFAGYDARLIVIHETHDSDGHVHEFSSHTGDSKCKGRRVCGFVDRQAFSAPGALRKANPVSESFRNYPENFRFRNVSENFKKFQCSNQPARLMAAKIR